MLTNAVTASEFILKRCMIKLGMTGMELSFFVATLMVLYFRLVMKSVDKVPPVFSVVTETFLHSIKASYGSHSASKSAEGGQEAGRGHS